MVDFWDFWDNWRFFESIEWPPCSTVDGANVQKNLDSAVRLSLDCAQAEFLTPERAVISLKGGELYVLSLLVDGMR